MKNIFRNIMFISFLLLITYATNAQIAYYVPSIVMYDSDFDLIDGCDIIVVADGSNEYTMYSGAYSIMEARQCITINPGFMVNPGAEYYGYIANSTQSKMILNQIANSAYQIESEGLNKKRMMEEEEDYTIYPNPNNGLFFIKISDISEKSTCSVYNNLGALIETVNIVDNETPIDISNVSPGVYLVKIMNGNKVVTKKVIKK